MKLSEATSEYIYKEYFRNQAIQFGSHNFRKKLKEDTNFLKKEIIPLIPQDLNISILDMGCGYGSMIYLLKHLGYKKIIGIDISDEQVKVAHQLNLKEVFKFDALDFLSKNINAFDLILGIDFIEHYEKNNLLNLFEHLKLSLKENGIVVLRTPNIDAPFGTTYAFGDITHQTLFNYTSAYQLMNTLNFSDVEVFPSIISTNGIIKNAVRKLLWLGVCLNAKVTLFASGKSTRNVLLTPNLLIKARK